MTDWRNEAPANGTVYALLRTSVIFRNYQSLDEVASIMENSELLEVHLFDKEKEYRKISTRDGFIEVTVTDPVGTEESKDTMYEEAIFVLETGADQAEDFKKQVTVVNYITYNQDDMITIKNYRLKEVE